MVRDHFQVLGNVINKAAAAPLRVEDDGIGGQSSHDLIVPILKIALFCLLHRIDELILVEVNHFTLRTVLGMRSNELGKGEYGRDKEHVNHGRINGQLILELER